MIMLINQSSYLWHQHVYSMHTYSPESRTLTAWRLSTYEINTMAIQSRSLACSASTSLFDVHRSKCCHNKPVFCVLLMKLAALLPAKLTHMVPTVDIIHFILESIAENKVMSSLFATPSSTPPKKRQSQNSYIPMMTWPPVGPKNTPGSLIPVQGSTSTDETGSPAGTPLRTTFLIQPNRLPWLTSSIPFATYPLGRPPTYKGSAVVRYLLLPPSSSFATSTPSTRMMPVFLTRSKSICMI